MMWKHHYFTYSTMLYYTRVTKNSAKIFTIALHFSSKVCVASLPVLILSIFPLHIQIYTQYMYDIYTQSIILCSISLCTNYERLKREVVHKDSE